MDRRPQYRPNSYRPAPQRQQAPKRRMIWGKIIFAILLVAVVGTVVVVGAKHVGEAQSKTGAKATKTAATATKPAATAPATAPSVCADNVLAQNVYVSVSKRHLWACEGTKQVYDSAVVTGMENIAADLTPVGTYHIYGKQTNLYLDGSDSTGSWHDFVNYWMPWLNNQYGTYGFHDATWRAAGDFGNIDPYSSNASHGCVELPLATAKWLYDWAVIGTTVTIQS